MYKIFVGIDNGKSGSIGVVGEVVDFLQTPGNRQLSYQKSKTKYITRLDVPVFHSFLKSLVDKVGADKILIGYERPLVNSRMFTATLSAVRFLEAQLVVTEMLDIPYIYLDSKEWQKYIFPYGVRGSVALKKASLDIGNRLYPQFKNSKHPDRDGLLIAHYLREKYK